MDILDRIRPFVVGITVVSFSISALLGIVALLRGTIGSTEGNILATTTIVGAVSLAVLCCVTPSGVGRLVGAVGVVVALIPLVTSLILVWGSDPDPVVAQIAGTGALFTLLFAQTSLLLAMTRLDRRGARAVLLATAACSVGFVLLLMPWIWLDLFDPPEGYGRLQGVVGILAALGTIYLIAHRVVTGGLRGLTSATPEHDTDETAPRTDRVLPDDVWADIDSMSQATGRSAADIVREAVQRHREDLIAAGHLGP